MNSANAGKSTQAFAEKDLLHATYLPTSNPANGAPQLNLREKRPKRAMMSRLQHVCFVVFALAVLAITLVNASTSGNPTLSAEAQQFRDLLDTLDATTLHDILHEHFKDKYQHGVYQEDKSALEALHRQNAAVAQSLVNLAKRQDGTNGSITTTTTVETTTTEVTQTITSTSTPPPPPPPEPTPTPPPTPTTTPANPGTSTTTSSAPNPPVSTTTSSAPPPPPVSSTTTQATSTTSRTSSSVATTLVPSTTPTRTSTSATPTGSSGSSPEEDDVTTSIVYTTTLADGAVRVTTAITVVPAAKATKPSGTGAGTKTVDASLQTGLANNQYQLGGWTAGMGFLGMAAAWGL